jgi:large subunit ribosomal protein L29
MRADKLRDMTADELQVQLRELKDELFKLRFQHATAQLDNPLRLREVRRTIARVKTLLREKELGVNV